MRKSIEECKRVLLDDRGRLIDLDRPADDRGRLADLGGLGDLIGLSS